MADKYLTAEQKAAIGVWSEPYTTVIESGAIRRFAEAVGDTNPIHAAGLVAPPTFLVTLRTGAPRVDFERLRGVGGVDGGRDYEYLKPIKAGDRITATSRLADIYERSGRTGDMILTITETTYHNQDGELVAIGRATGITRMTVVS